MTVLCSVTRPNAKPETVSGQQKKPMRKIIYILSLFVLISCGQSNSKQNNTNQSEKTHTNTIENKTNEENDSLKTNIPKDSVFEIVESDYNPEEYRRESLNLSFEKAILFKLTDTIIADFNGDGIIDKASYLKENETSGIVIIHGGINEEIRIGFGEQIAHMTEFNWVDYWGLVMDKKTSEATFTEDGDILGSEDVNLQNPSIALGKDEVGGGLITYLNGRYVWIHQTC